MMRATWLGSLGLALALQLAWPQAAWAQDEDAEQLAQTEAELDDEPGRRSLAERIPSVTGRVFSKAGRAELYPAVGLTLNDPFFDHLPLGGGIHYHILESLSVGVAGEYFLNLDSPVTVTGGGNPARPNYNHPVYSARIEVSWAPIYGKVSLIAEDVVRFDTYLTVGGGVIGMQRGGPGFVGSVAIGQRYFFSNRWLALKLEVRDQIFDMARNPTISQQGKIQNLLSATLGLCFFLPAEVERERPTGGP